MTNAFGAVSFANSQTITVTLSRAHKINERINAKLTELRTVVANKGQAVNVQSHSGPEQLELIQKGAAQALGVVRTYVALVVTQASLRTAVAKVNATSGVSDVLTVIEKNKRLILLADSLASVTPTANTLSTEALRQRPLGETIKDFGSVAVSGLTADQLAPYAGASAELERENFALQDQLADLNAHKVSFQAVDDVLELLSLKAA